MLRECRFVPRVRGHVHQIFIYLKRLPRMSSRHSRCPEDGRDLRTIAFRGSEPGLDGGPRPGSANGACLKQAEEFGPTGTGNELWVCVRIVRSLEQIM